MAEEQNITPDSQNTESSPSEIGDIKDVLEQNKFPEYCMSVDEIQKILFQFTGTRMDKDDPLYQTVYILNAFLVRDSKRQKYYRDCLTQCIDTGTKKYFDQLGEQVDTLQQALSSTASDNLKKSCDEFTRSFESLQRAIGGLKVIMLSLTVAFIAGICALIFLR